MTNLLDAVRRFAESHGDPNGVARTPIPGLTAIRATRPSDLQYAISRPMVCLVLQGAKHVTMGTQACSFAAGDTLLIAADVPTVSQITAASRVAPYLSLVLDLDAATIAGLGSEMRAVLLGNGGPVRVEPTEVEVTAAAARAMDLIDRPSSLPILQHQLVREIHYWLLAGRLGPDIRHLGLVDGHAQRISKAVTILRQEFARIIPVERLASAAGMSRSSFHRYFKSVTSLSPLQFQKQLRLIEARRLIMEGVISRNVAYEVGYESVPQFTREYGRMFGLTPTRDRDAERSRARRAG